MCSEKLKSVVPRGATGPFWEDWVAEWNLPGEWELGGLDSCDLLPGAGVGKSCINDHGHESGPPASGVKNGAAQGAVFPHFLFCVEIQATRWLIHPTLAILSCSGCKDEWIREPRKRERELWS